jgi:hypothetical protein
MAVLVPNRDDWFVEEHGFPHPDWEAIHSWIERSVAKGDLEDAWQQSARHWLERLRVRLGGDHVNLESANFHLLSDLPPAESNKVLSLLETTRSRIARVLGDTSAPEAHGKHVVLRFGEVDDYYRYIAHFGADGEYAGSVGMFVGSAGYQHVAFARWNTDEERRTLVHELAHNLVAHLPLPLWLNEALAMAFETDIAGGEHEGVTRELAGRHRDYWTPETIQEFWIGRSFSDVEGQELAYSLSRILLHLIYTEIRPPEGEFRRFVLSADWADAGAAAAEEHLEISLENLVAAFLGPGDWMPRPEAWDDEEKPESPGDAY